MRFNRPPENSARPDNYILANLPEDEYAQLRRSLLRVDLPQGFKFAGPGDLMEHVYFPTHGVVSTDAVTEKGDSIEIGVTGSEGLIGTSALLGQPELMHTVVMQVAGQGLRARVPAVQELMRRGGHLTDLVYEHIALQMLQMGQSALCNRLHDVKSRLARWLLTASDRNQSDQLELTQEFLSQMLGSRRSTVTVMAGELQRERLIEYSRGRITISNRHDLEQVACECYGIVSSAYKRVLQKDRSGVATNGVVGAAGVGRLPTGHADGAHPERPIPVFRPR
jgi:CRP-like cAMP-binding protein